MLLCFCGFCVFVLHRSFNPATISSCRLYAMMRAVGVRINSVASLRSLSSACWRTFAMTSASVYVGLACLVYPSARSMPIWPRASSLSASLTMWRTRA